MYKVMIVDDNVAIVELMGRIINWKEEGFEIISTAYDGREALKNFLHQPADILLVDIRMPEMDGFELISEIRKLKNDTKFIVLTAYDEFSLVRKAFRLGANEYILKTEVDPDNLREILRRLASQIEKEHQVRGKSEIAVGSSEGELPWGDMNASRRHLKNLLLNELCHGYIKYREIPVSKLKFLNIQCREGFHRVMLLSFDNLELVLKRYWNGEEQLLIFAVMNILEELVEAPGYGDVFYAYSSGYGIVFSFQQPQEEEFFSSFFNEIRGILERFLRLESSAGISNNAWGEDKFHELLVESQRALQYRFILGKGELVFSSRITAENMLEDIIPYERLEFLKNTLQTLNPEIIRQSIKTAIIGEKGIQLDQLPEVMRLYEKYTFIIYDFIEQNHLEGAPEKLLKNLEDSILEREALQKVNKVLQELLEAIAQRLSSGNRLVRQAADYILERYNQNINLQAAANSLGVNAAYLGRLMMKEMGISFNDLLNHTRIEKAKDLLTNSNMRIYEVSEMVGYVNTDHFSRMFKKYVGLAPKDFIMGRS